MHVEILKMPRLSMYHYISEFAYIHTTSAIKPKSQITISYSRLSTKVFYHL